MPAISRNPRYLSQEDAAELLGVTTRAIRKWIADGVIPAYKIGKRAVRIKASDLDAALVRIPAAGGGR